MGVDRAILGNRQLGLPSAPPPQEDSMSQRLPLCFVLMPFGSQACAAGVLIDFDAVYRDLVAPAVEQAGLEPLREEQTGGVIDKPMFERLLLSEHAVADLTLADPNVFYELGLRHGLSHGQTHGIRAGATAALFAEGAGRLPFDAALLRGLPYLLGADGRPARIDADRAALVARLKAQRETAADSPLVQLVDGFADIQRLKTDVFRERVDYSRHTKQRLAHARQRGADAVHAIGSELAASPTWASDTEAAILVDLCLSYRAVKDWPAMIALVAAMPAPLAATTLVQEQLGFALNRAGRPDDAQAVLTALIVRRGASSETCGILGRVFKDRWEAALRAGDRAAAQRWLVNAIDAYLQGFEADWRDAYPGVNAVTLMELKEPPDPRRTRLIPVVAYAVERRIAASRPDYWDHATRLELAVLARDEGTASAALEDALAAVREPWEPESTARNLRLIRQCREQRGEPLAWAAALERALDRRAA